MSSFECKIESRTDFPAILTTRRILRERLVPLHLREPLSGDGHGLGQWNGQDLPEHLEATIRHVRELFAAHGCDDRG